MNSKVYRIIITILLVVIVMQLGVIIMRDNSSHEYDLVMSSLSTSTDILTTWSEAGWQVAGVTVVQGTSQPYLYAVIYR